MENHYCVLQGRKLEKWYSKESFFFLIVEDCALQRLRDSDRIMWQSIPEGNIRMHV